MSTADTFARQLPDWLQTRLDSIAATEAERSTARLLFRQPNGLARARNFIKEIEMQRQPEKGQLDLFKDQEGVA